jgi:hypothetical protein
MIANAAVWHTAVLHGVVAATLVATALTLRRRASRFALRHVLWAVWPFALLEVLEMLNLSASGHLVAQIALPCLATIVVFIFSRSVRVIRWSRWILIGLAWGLWLHGGYLLTNGYMTNPRANILREQIEPRWYTPLTGLQPRVRPPRLR